jgi:hypothetical protein
MDSLLQTLPLRVLLLYVFQLMLARDGDVSSGNSQRTRTFVQGVVGRTATPPRNAAEAHAINSVAAARDSVGNALLRIPVGTGKRWGREQREWQNYRQICKGASCAVPHQQVQQRLTRWIRCCSAWHGSCCFLTCSSWYWQEMGTCVDTGRRQDAALFRCASSTKWFFWRSVFH